MSSTPDQIFANPRLAAIYDALDPDRSDLEPYRDAIVTSGARTVLDVGCGTGTFAVLLAGLGLAVTAVDPAAASLDVAKAKPGADRVEWIHGDTGVLPNLAVDFATMTANVAQVFVSESYWLQTLTNIGGALKPAGQLMFEVRDPDRRTWESWTPENTHRVVDLGIEVGRVETWTELESVDLPFVSFSHHYRFARDGAEVVSESTLRFRPRTEVEQALSATGYRIDDVRDAPDRPGKEFVFLASVT